MDSTIIFEDHELKIEWRRGGSARAYVTFSNWEPRTSSKRQGLWKNRLDYAVASGFFFIAKQNHWYNVAAMEACVEVVRNLLTGYTEIIAMGSSMGGFAAIRFANRLGANTVVAISPQYSVHPILVGDFENRYDEDVKDIDFQYLSATDWKGEALHKLQKIYILYDNLDKKDHKHATRIAATSRVPVQLVKFPGSNHPTGFVLEECELLHCIFQIGSDQDQAVQVLIGMRKGYREKRSASGNYWIGIWRALLQRRKSSWFSVKAYENHCSRIHVSPHCSEDYHDCLRAWHRMNSAEFLHVGERKLAIGKFDEYRLELLAEEDLTDVLSRMISYGVDAKNTAWVMAGLETEAQLELPVVNGYGERALEITAQHFLKFEEDAIYKQCMEVVFDTEDVNFRDFQWSFFSMQKGHQMSACHCKLLEDGWWRLEGFYYCQAEEEIRVLDVLFGGGQGDATKIHIRKPYLLKYESKKKSCPNF